MRVAINKNLINKQPDKVGLYNKRFISTDITITQLADEVKKGYAFCPQIKPGCDRSKPNFVASGFLAVDIDPDSNLSLEAAFNMPYVQNYASLVYTTPSHTEDVNRFRIVFELEEPIADANRMASALKSLVAMFKADEHCKDPAHFFFGNTNAKIWLFDKKMPTTVVDTLVMLSEDKQKPKHSQSSDGDTVTKRSSLTVGKDQLIDVKDGGSMFLNLLPPGTKVRCINPTHFDYHPSAIVRKTKTGNNCIFCFKCRETYFLEGASISAYNFDHDWLKPLSSEESRRWKHYSHLGMKAPKPGPIEDQYGYLPSVLNSQRFDISRDFLPYAIAIDMPQLNAGDVAARYPLFTDDMVLSKENNVSLRQALEMRERGEGYLDSDLDTAVKELAEHRWLKSDGITYIKSPKGTGKTHLLQQAVDYYKGKDPRKPKVLVIAHRRSLINSISGRLKLTSYLKSKSGKQEKYNDPDYYYAICLDSMANLLKPEEHSYEIIIIDEVEQVFSHLLSSTLKGKRGNVLATLQHYLKKARHIFALDADLSVLTMNVMAAMESDWPNRHEFAIINHYKQAGQLVLLYEHIRKDNIIGALVIALQNKERCYVCTNSRAMAKKIHAQLQKDFPDLKTMLITAENSNEPDGQFFIQNIVAESPKYDLIVASPSLGTGIDITFPEEASLIDSVFGIFNARVNTHFDMDQQIARVRHPKNVHVWVSSEQYISETDPDIIAMDIEAMQGKFNYQGFDDMGRPIIGPIDLLHKKIYAAVAQTRRASMNRLRQNFRDLKEHQGCTIVDVRHNKKVARLGSTLMKLADEAHDEAERENLLSAGKISYAEYDCLKGKPSLSDEERYRRDRFSLEKFYRQDIDAALIARDNGGKLREAVRLYMLLVSPDDHQFWGIFDADLPSMDKAVALKTKWSLIDVLSAAGIWKNGDIDPNAEIEHGGLGSFMEACIRNEQLLLDHHDISLRGDLKKKPKRQLSDVLAKIGLDTARTARTDQSNNQYRRFYPLDEDRYENLMWAYQRHINPDNLAKWRAERSATDSYISDDTSDSVFSVDDPD